ncbi:MAG: hypothetical protein KGQ60_11920 [Planctomycetes bacterium]|nr:hypothetical protein [Planctomycetota bacterium]
MTITRVGTNEKYATNWESIFGGRKSKSTSVKTVTKEAAKPAKKAAAKAVKKSKAATPKKAAAKPAKKTAKKKK